MRLCNNLREACGLTMSKIKMKNACNIKASEAFDRFVISKQACGLKEVTIRNYRNHYHSISKFFDWDRP